MPGTRQPWRLQGIGQIPQTQAIGGCRSFGPVTLCLHMEPSEVTRILVSNTEDTCKSRAKMVGGFPLPHRHCSLTRCGRFGMCNFLSHFPGQEKEKKITTSHLFLPLDRHHHHFLLSQEAGSLAYLLKLPVSIRFPHRRMC